jgi:MoaA/NifB/PqqE/SkfB family radical SAM enzyme
MLSSLRYKYANGVRASRRWVIPYINARIHADEFHPILCYLFTDWKCNLDCHYCFQNDSAKPGMTLEAAKDSIDWLKSVGCRNLSLMGGEPLVRKDFILEVIRYGSKNGFFVYLPTNGYLMDKPFIDEVGKAGVAAINLAVDCIAPRKGLPKALLNIEPQFRYLVEKQKDYGYILFFNINICRSNIKDARMLTEIAHQNRIGTDYHLNEPPHGFVDITHYKHNDDGLSITPDQYDAVDELLNWLIEKQRHRWPMVNSISHLQAFKDRMRGRLKSWSCTAGQAGILIRPDLTLASCFDMITLDHDWGRVGAPRFDKEELAELKKKCMPLCSSTCFYNLSHYCEVHAIPEIIMKHMRVG